MLQAAVAVLRQGYGALRESNQALSGLELKLHHLVDNFEQTEACTAVQQYSSPGLREKAIAAPIEEEVGIENLNK